MKQRSRNKAQPRPTRTPKQTTSALGRAGDAAPGGGDRLQAGFADRLAAQLAVAVGAGVELGQGPLDVLERLFQRLSQRLRLAALGRDLARVGEVGVVVVAGDGAVTKTSELGLQFVALGRQGRPYIRQR